MNKIITGADFPLFRTVVEVENCSTKIVPEANLMFIGSCFTKNIGNKCASSCLSTSINPFGVVYNPISIASQIERLLDEKTFTADEIHFLNGLYHTFEHHSSFSNQNKEQFIESINNSLSHNSAFLNTCNFLFITLGTANAFYYNETGELVANCHKYPSKRFENRLLSVEEIVSCYSNLLERLFAKKPSLQVVFSVSPIRHQRDGFRNNNLSKATLLIAIKQIQHKFPQIHYFEAYELVMDELRDYRFFTEDMIHINNIALDYIWNKFTNAFFADSTFNMVEKHKKIVADLNHRPFNPSGTEYTKFLRAIDLQLKNFKSNYPFLNITNLKSELENRLKLTIE